MPDKKPSIGIVGCGRMGTALGKTLAGLGYPFAGVSSLHVSSARRVADLCGIETVSDQPWEMTHRAGVVFITTPDDVIMPVCRRIAEEGGFASQPVVLHCSGAHPSTILESARLSGASIGSMHPLQSFASIDIQGNPFDGIRVAIEGDHQAILTASCIATDLGATPFEIQTDGKALYHAAAVVASNFLVTLMDVAFRLAEKSGIPPEAAFSVLRPLIDGTLANIGKVGICQALTGPVVRGDFQTVETHIEKIGQTIPEILPFYQSMIQFTAQLAKTGGRITDDTLQQFMKMG
ncbi:MAG: Rossmann-like and DUF2520 domain-containing protein [Desulfatirhabdiaceae bacterium]